MQRNWQTCFGKQ